MQRCAVWAIAKWVNQQYYGKSVLTFQCDFTPFYTSHIYVWIWLDVSNLYIQQPKCNYRVYLGSYQSLKTEQFDQIVNSWTLYIICAILHTKKCGLVRRGSISWPFPSVLPFRHLAFESGCPNHIADPYLALLFRGLCIKALKHKGKQNQQWAARAGPPHLVEILQCLVVFAPLCVRHGQVVLHDGAGARDVSRRPRVQRATHCNKK